MVSSGSVHNGINRLIVEFKKQHDSFQVETGLLYIVPQEKVHDLTVRPWGHFESKSLVRSS
jgi:hypothetical protein